MSTSKLSPSLTLRMPQTELDRLAEAARAHDRSISAEARRAIRLYLDTLEQRRQPWTPGTSA